MCAMDAVTEAKSSVSELFLVYKTCLCQGVVSTWQPLCEGTQCAGEMCVVLVTGAHHHTGVVGHSYSTHPCVRGKRGAEGRTRQKTQRKSDLNWGLAILVAIGYIHRLGCVSSLWGCPASPKSAGFFERNLSRSHYTELVWVRLTGGSLQRTRSLGWLSCLLARH